MKSYNFKKTLIKHSCLSALLLLAGCKAVGPDYTGAPIVLSETLQKGHFVRADQIVTPAAVPINEWWKAFNDPLLNHLVEQALEANPNVQIAESRLKQSRASFRLEQANGLPSGGASAVYAHGRIPPISLGQSSSSSNTSGGTGSSSNSSGSGGASQFDLYNVALDATWEIDLFGGRRRTIESAKANSEAAQGTLEDAQVSLTAEVANAYVNLRDCQQRLLLGQTSVQKQENMLKLTQQRVNGGTASQLDLIRLQNQLESTRSGIVPIQAERDGYMNQLATLLGKEPGTLDAQLNAPGAVLLPPASVAVGDPATLLKHRPDIRAAERNIAASNAKIGQAEAARFPSLKLLGFIGIGGTQPSDLTRLDDFTAIAAPMLSWNFMDFGRNSAKISQAKEARNEAEIKYRQTILEALRNAEDALSKFKYGRINVATLARNKVTAMQALNLTSQRYRAGTASMIDVLDATRQQITAEQNLLQGETTLTQSFIAIQKALGLGWKS